MCDRTSLGRSSQGVTATHLFAKIDGEWVEPENVCVAAYLPFYNGMGFGVQNTVDGGFPETHLPPGTLISVGIHRPPEVALQNGFGGWRNAIVVSDEDDTVVQGRTNLWEYHGEAFFDGPGLDCALHPVVWPSTFTGWFGLIPLGSDGRPDPKLAQYAGAFYESNTVGATFPRLLLDDDGIPTGVRLDVQGCGDGDPTTLEGYFDGFTPMSQLRALGINPALLRDIAVLQDLIEVEDARTGERIRATFRPVTRDELTPEPIPGVTMPEPPSGPDLLGIYTEARYSYSRRVLVQRARPGVTRALRNCRAEGGTPVAVDGQLTCRGVPRLRAKLAARRSVRAGKAVTISCSKPCSAVATVTARGRRLAGGHAKTGKAGNLRVPLKLTAAGRARLAPRSSVRATLRATVMDGVGNTVRLKRALRLTR